MGQLNLLSGKSGESTLAKLQFTPSSTQLGSYTCMDWGEKWYIANQVGLAKSNVVIS